MTNGSSPARWIWALRVSRILVMVLYLGLDSKAGGGADLGSTSANPPRDGDFHSGERSERQLEFLLGRVAVLAVKEQVEHLLQQPHGATVADGGEVGVAAAVDDRETEPKERKILVAGDILAVGGADQKVGPVILDELVQVKLVGAEALLEDDLVCQITKHRGDSLVEVLARRAGNDVDGNHVEVDQKFGHRDELVGVAEEGDALAMEILVHVGDDVEDPAPLIDDRVGDVPAVEVPERGDEAVGRPQTDRQLEQLAGDLTFGLQRLGGQARGSGA